MYFLLMQTIDKLLQFRSEITTWIPIYNALRCRFGISDTTEGKCKNGSSTKMPAKLTNSSTRKLLYLPRGIFLSGNN